MKIAFVTQGFSTSGGVQALARWLRSGLTQRGHEIDVFDIEASSRASISRRLLSPISLIVGPQIVESDEPGVVRVGAALGELEPLRYLPTSALTAELASYDIVQVVAGGPALATVAKRASRPIFLHIATLMKWERESIHRALPAPERMLKTALTVATSALEKRALRSAEAVFVLNAEMLAAVENLAPDTYASIAPPGIDTRVFKPVKRWDGCRPIVAVGRLAEQRKGWDRIVRSYQQLQSCTADVPPLRLIGRGELMASTERLIRDLGLEASIEIHSDASHEKLVSLLQDASLFWQASHEEGLGIAVLEAMACGVPVVATETAGTRMTVVHGATGYLVPQDDFRLIERFVRHTMDILGGAGDRFSVAGRNRVVKHFDGGTTLDRFEQAYRNVLTAWNKEPQ